MVDGTLPPAPPATGELQVTANNNATQLVNAMLILPAPTGVTISNATYVGAVDAAGTYINGDEVPLEIYPTRHHSHQRRCGDSRK